MYKNSSPNDDALESIRSRLVPAKRTRKSKPVNPGSHRKMKFKDFEAGVIEEQEYELRHAAPPTTAYKPSESSIRAQEQVFYGKTKSKSIKKKKSKKKPRITCPGCRKKFVNVDDHSPHCKGL